MIEIGGINKKNGIQKINQKNPDILTTNGINIEESYKAVNYGFRNFSKIYHTKRIDFSGKTLRCTLGYVNAKILLTFCFLEKCHI